MELRHVAGPDAAFLAGERPEWQFHVSALLVLEPGGDGRFGVEAVRDLLERRIHRVPQFRWRLSEGPLRLGLDQPIWVDDDRFDLDRHLHNVAVPAPGDDRALARLLGPILGTRLERHKPLWEMWVIEGLAGGRSALLAKIHHSIIDGTSGAELATLLFDLEPDPPPDPDPPPWRPEPAPSTAARLAASTVRTITSPQRTARLLAQSARQGVTFARHALGSSTAAQPFQAPRTPFNGALGPDRTLAVAAVDLDAAKRVKAAFDVKLNDVVLAITAGALRSWLVSLDALPEKPLVAQVPVSLRGDADRGHVGTKVAAMFATLATDVADPAERLRAIARGTVDAKSMRRSLDADHTVNLTDTLPPAAITVAARAWSAAGLDARTPPVFNLIVSNVAGPPFDLHVAGARISAMYPMGPLLYGSGLNVTVASTPDRLDFGLLACPDRVPDAWALADRIPPALDELVASIG